MNPPRPPRIRYRQIAEPDIPAIVSLLARRFPRRTKSYWMRGFERLIARNPVEGYPRFGYLLENGANPVGALLLIFTTVTIRGVSAVRCNLSSWCVEPEYSGYSSLLIAAALKHKNVTYINISPAAHTLRTIVAQGFRCYSKGQYLALPAFCGGRRPGTARRFDANADYGVGLAKEEHRLLTEHAAYGCIVLTVTDGAEVHPFAFVPRKVGLGALGVPSVHLCYCRDVDAFCEFAGPIGRYLLARGRPLALVDANNALGLPGRFFPGRAAKYFNGPQPPHLGDLAYTEIALFGP